MNINGINQLLSNSISHAMITKEISIDKSHLFEFTVVKNLKKSSIISIFDKTLQKNVGQFEITQILQKGVVYNAKFQEGKLLLQEFNKSNFENKIKKISDFFVNSSVESNDNNSILNFLFIFLKQTNLDLIKDFDNPQKYNHFKDNKDNFYFVFSIPIFEIESKQIIKVDKEKNVFLEIFFQRKMSVLQNQKLSDVIEILKKSLNTKINSFYYNVSYNIFDYSNRICEIFEENTIDVMV